MTHLVAQGHRVIGCGAHTAPGMPGIPLMRYTLKRQPTAGLHRYVAPLENGVLYGQAVYEKAMALAAQGFEPDVMLVHPGWGEALFLKEAFPRAKLISFFEFFYHAHGADAGFDPIYPSTPDDHARIRIKNALHLLNLEMCDAGVSPTEWQRSLHPKAYQFKLSLIHEGINCDYLQPDSSAVLTLADGRTFRFGDPVVTYVARNLEPYRGFHILMRTLPSLLRAHSTVQVVIVGADGSQYGRPPQEAATWRELLLREIGDRVDWSRVHFTGRLTYQAYRQLLQVSAAHLYLTYPFVLSWSMLEAMSCECLVVGSATPPVQEIIEHGVNGQLVDFFDCEGWSQQLLDILENPGAYVAQRKAARQTILKRFPLQAGIEGYQRLF
ncbi:MAG: glycosyltransferase [Burkholderiaceae bacterium]